MENENKDSETEPAKPEGECCGTDCCDGTDSVAQTKQFRKDLDGVLQNIKEADRQSRERSLAVTKLQDAIMWLGMDLKAQNEANPYPSSYDPSSPTIELTADELKL